MNTKPITLLAAMLFGAAGIGQAAIINLGINEDEAFATGDTVTGDAQYSDGTNHTWTVDGNMIVGDGSSNAGRFFVTILGNSGELTLTGANGSGDMLTLDGFHSADPVLGRIGHNNAAVTSTLNITGGLTVSMGGRNLKVAQGINTINVLDGSLDYSLSAFGFQKNDGGGSLGHVIGASGSIVIDGVITDAAGFTNWADENGLDATVLVGTVTADSGLTLNFSNDGTNTTITAVPEPSSAALLGLGGIALLLRRRK